MMENAFEMVKAVAYICTSLVIVTTTAVFIAAVITGVCKWFAKK